MSHKNSLIKIQDLLENTGSKSFLKRMVYFLGPGFIASIAYIDPGNFATNIESGSKFGYTLLWVILLSNLAAILIQTMSAKLGIASGKSLAEVIRDEYPSWVKYPIWIIMEIVAMATDLAEFLGAALGIYLLFPNLFFWCQHTFNTPLLVIPATLAGIATFLILGLEKYGFRKIEIAIAGMVGVITLSYVTELFIGNPDWNLALQAIIVPKFAGKESLLLTAGIVGATIMPHAIFLHSGLMKQKHSHIDKKYRKKIFKFVVIDILISMGIAGIINMAMLIMAASTFYTAGIHTISSIEDAYKTLQPLLGHSAQVIFAISLLISGYASSAVGTMAGQMIMQGFVKFSVPTFIRRFVTMVPAFVLIWLNVEPGKALIMSQVVLSFGLPFAIIPLIVFSKNERIMGNLKNKKITTLTAGLIGLTILGLNILLIYQYILY